MKQFETFWQKLEKLIKSVKTDDKVFNQYSNCNPNVDVRNAASIRTANLKAYMKLVIGPDSVLIVGEAPSYQGARFSGIPFFGEKQVIDPQFQIMNGRQSSNSNAPYCSPTDTIFWEVMLEYYRKRKFLCWNAFPLHPHRPAIAMTNRTPRKAEVCQFRDALKLIKDYLKPSHIIAVGRIAEKHLRQLDETSKYVRHPAHGGKTEFAKAMRQLFETV